MWNLVMLLNLTAWSILFISLFVLYVSSVCCYNLFGSASFGYCTNSRVVTKVYIYIRYYLVFWFIWSFLSIYYFHSRMCQTFLDWIMYWFIWGELKLFYLVTIGGICSTKKNSIFHRIQMPSYHLTLIPLLEKFVALPWYFQ